MIKIIVVYYVIVYINIEVRLRLSIDLELDFFVEGDCSFHIRRKHHRYSANSNDYIQRFLFDTSEGDESLSTQTSGNHSTNNLNSNREQEEPVRYFGCSYCDYTSNYGGDVR